MSEIAYVHTIEDVAKMFGVNPETVRRWCRSGKLKFFKLPGKKGEYRISMEDIKDFIARQNTEGFSDDGVAQDLETHHSKRDS